VRAPGRYPLPDEEEASLSLLDLILKAGGLTDTSDAQHIRIVSFSPDGSTQNRVVSVDDILRGRVRNVMIQTDDQVFVPRSPPP
jgi:polysaccharide export outer membrane protein